MKKVEGKQDGKQAVLLLHLVVLVGRSHIELAQLDGDSWGPFDQPLDH